MQKTEIIILAGKPYSGKSSLSKKLVEIKDLGNVRLLPMGERLRAIASGEIKSKYSDVLATNLDTLKLHNPVPKEIPLAIFEEFILEDPSSLIILDGFPRYPDRMDGFEDTLSRLDAKILAIIRVDVDDDIVYERMHSREQRYDDVEENLMFVNKRINDYKTNMIPTLERLVANSPLYIIDGTKPFEDNVNKIIDIFKKESSKF